MKLRSILDLATEQLKELHSAESQIIKVIPQISTTALSPALRRLFRERGRQAEVHISRLGRVSKKLGTKLAGPKCKGMEAIIQEGKESLRRNAGPNLIDSILIATARRWEHYEIAAYGTARTYVEALGKGRIGEFLQASLDEEIRMDEKLNTLAEKSVNLEADIRL